MSYITDIALSNFRNHRNLAFECQEKFVLLIGKNGVGKSNILEALSLFSTGRGMRSAKNAELINFKNQQEGFLIKIQYLSNNLTYNIKFHYDYITTKKTISCNQNKNYKQSEISEILKVIWMTPQMENLFLESAVQKRKFFDRIVYNFFPNHGSLMLKYDYFVRSRNKILTFYHNERHWLDDVEDKLAHLNANIFKNRKQAINILNSFLDDVSLKKLKPFVKIEGTLELIMEKSEDPIFEIKKNLFDKRKSDVLSKKTHFGSHRTEFVTIENNREAKFFSTGEQKSILISLILAQSKAIEFHTKIAPILILDEVFAHIDDKNISEIIEILNILPSQFFISSTNDKLIDFVKGDKKILYV